MIRDKGELMIEDRSGSEQPTHAKRRKPGRRTIMVGAVAAVITVALAVALLLSPKYSPLGFVHDADGDGVADSNDDFPHDPTRSEKLSIVITMNKETISNEFYRYCIFSVENIDGGRIPLTDVYIEVKDDDGSLGLSKTQLTTMSSVNWTLYGVSFFNIQDENMYYLDPADSFTLNMDKYYYGSVLTLMNEFGEEYCSYTV